MTNAGAPSYDGRGAADLAPILEGGFPFDGLIVDLDGVVWIGERAVPGAPGGADETERARHRHRLLDGPISIGRISRRSQTGSRKGPH
jgi:hypothetical protein